MSRSVDLSITKTHVVGNFSARNQRCSTRSASGNGTGVGLEQEDNTITVTDTVPTGFSYVSGTGTDQQCRGPGGHVQSPAAARAGRNAPDLSLTVLPGQTAAPSKVNTAVVSSRQSDFNTANDARERHDQRRAAEPLTSTKTVSDLNARRCESRRHAALRSRCAKRRVCLAPNVRVHGRHPANVMQLQRRDRCRLAP